MPARSVRGALHDLSLRVEGREIPRQVDNLLAQFRWFENLQLCAKAEQIATGFFLNLKGQARIAPAMLIRLAHLLKANKASRVDDAIQRALGCAHADRVAWKIGHELGGGTLPVGGEVEIGGTRAGLVQQARLLDTRDAIGTYLALDGGHQVPDAALRDQAQGVQHALNGLVLALVANRYLAFLPDRLLEQREIGQLLLAWPLPARHVYIDALAHIFGVLAHH